MERDNEALFFKMFRTKKRSKISTVFINSIILESIYETIEQYEDVVDFEIVLLFYLTLLS